MKNTLHGVLTQIQMHKQGLLLNDWVFMIFAFLLFAAFPMVSVAGSPFKIVPRLEFRTNILAFEDNVLFDTPSEGSLVYRTEGTGKITRHTQYPNRYIEITGPVGYIHPAQYNHPTLKLAINIQKGEPAIAICNNGITDNSGKLNPSPGVEIVLARQETQLRDLKTGNTVAHVPEALPRNRRVNLSIFWDFDKRLIRLDLPKHSYELKMPKSVTAKGGFALRAPAKPETAYQVLQIQVIWQENRNLVLYDGRDTIFDALGKQIGKIPPIVLPDGATQYATTAVDLERERSLILFAGDNFSTFPETFKGWAVRDLKTGKLDVISHESSINGCIPYQGGGSMDGYWMLQSWNPPASTCWLDWNAYNRGDLKNFVVPAGQAEKHDPAFIGFHDPSNALDGSIARYLRITESWQGTNHLTVHPNLAPFAPFSDISMPPPTHPLLSHTGPAGLPTQLVVRDRDRAWYEQWAYLGNGLHSQNRGYNIFARKDDWSGAMHPVEKGSEPYQDYANMAPSLTDACRLIAIYYSFDTTKTGYDQCTPLSANYLRWSGGPFVVERNLPVNPAATPFQMLMERSELK